MQDLTNLLFSANSSTYLIKNYDMKIALIFCFIVLTHCLRSQIPVNDHKENIVVLGIIKDNKPSFIGTGFLVDINGVIHLITAKHVVTKIKNNEIYSNEIIEEEIFAFFQQKNGKIIGRSISSLQEKHKFKWIFHQNPNVDIAITPFRIDESDKVKVIQTKDFLDTKHLFETYNVYFVSYHPSLMNLEDFSPIFRTGTISRINNDRTIYLDAFAFPGNSGSPVFLIPSPIRFDSNKFNIGSDPLGDKFIGIIGAYITYEEVAVSVQTQRPRIIFQENSGLTKIWTVNYINDILNSKEMKLQIDNFK